MEVRLHKGQPVGWVWQVEGGGEAVPLIPHTDVAEIGPWLQQRCLNAHEGYHAVLSYICHPKHMPFLKECGTPTSLGQLYYNQSCSNTCGARCRAHHAERQQIENSESVVVKLAYLWELPVDLHGRSIVEQQRRHSG